MDTQHALRQALSRLLWRKTPEEITLRELTEAAGIRRSTFHAHYSGISALLLELQDTLLGELDALLPQESPYGTPEFYMALTGHLYKNGEFFRIFFADARFRDRLAAMLLEKRPGQPETLTRQFQAAYQIQGTIGVLRQWVEAGFPCPQYDLAQLLFRLEAGDL